jgi:hypothetical protein
MRMGRRRCLIGDGARREGWRRARNTALRCQHPSNYAFGPATYWLKISGFAAQIGSPIHVS